MTVHVVILTPPVDSSGGIGRLVQYEQAVWGRDSRLFVRHLDTRGRGSAVASLIRLPLVVARLVVLRLRRRADVAHVNMSSRASALRKSVVIWSCVVLRIPVVVHLHGSGWDSFFNKASRVVQGLLRRTFAHAAAVVVLGEYWKSFVRSTVGVPPQRIVVLPNAVPGPGVVAPPVREPGAPLRILFSGRVGDRKGTWALVEAVTQLAQETDGTYALEIAGDGDLERLDALAAALPSGACIRRHGWVSQQAVLSLLRTSHVLALPSRAENQPLAVIEAMAWAVVPIASNVGAIPDLIDNNATGILMPAADVPSLKSAIRRLHDDDAERLALARASHMKWAAEFNIEDHMQRLADVWLAARGRSNG